jgi:3-oxoacyl-[acyl-carrier-protein] synthase-3
MPSEVFINDIASFLPNAPVANDAIEDVLGLIDGKKSRSRRIVLKNNGIKTRYYAIDPKTAQFTHNNAEMTAEAVRTLLKKSGISQENIETLTCGTSGPDQIQPAHGHMVQGELKMHPCEVATTAGVCLSGMSAMKYAYMNIALGHSTNAVSTGSEYASSWMRASNFETETDLQVETLKKKPALAFEKDFLRWMLSDGAAAALLSPNKNKDRHSLKIEWIDILSYSGELPACMYAGAVKKDDGSLEGWRQLDAPYEEAISKHYFALKQDTRLLEQYITPKSAEALSTISKKRDLNVDAIDWFLPHYSSDFFRGRLYDCLAEKGVEIPYDKWFTNLHEVGNVGSASIYLILEALFYSDKLKHGDKILCYIPESARFSYAYMYLTVV